MPYDSDHEMIRGLAEFRYQLRGFLRLSEEAAHAAGLQPQQHQLLLQLAGGPELAERTIAWAAERLELRHNSTVELVDRSVKQGLLRRCTDPKDHRRVLLQITPRGKRVLQDLSVYHARELNELRPKLLLALRRVGRRARARQIPETTGQS